MSPDRPMFSVIIPLECHRGQWEQSWLGWMLQTAEKSLYEIILVAPPDFTARAELKALASDKARIEYADFEHDIGLCAFGATKARGKYLFFTESHCRPETDVIALCIRAIDDHPDWAGFSIVRIRAPLDRIGTHLYLDGAAVDPGAIVVGRDGYTLSLDLPPSGIATLAWSCPVLRGVNDSRRLGLSIVAIDVGQSMPEAGSAGCGVVVR